MNNNQNNKDGKKPNGQNIGVMVMILLITVVIVSFMISELKKRQQEEVPYNEFVQMIEDGDIEAVQFSGNRIYITPDSTSTE